MKNFPPTLVFYLPIKLSNISNQDVCSVHTFIWYTKVFKMTYLVSKYWFTIIFFFLFSTYFFWNYILDSKPGQCACTSESRLRECRRYFAFLWSLLFFHVSQSWNLNQHRLTCQKTKLKRFQLKRIELTDNEKFSACSVNFVALAFLVKWNVKSLKVMKIKYIKITTVSVIVGMSKCL